jgi:hypothetical protein
VPDGDESRIKEREEPKEKTVFEAVDKACSPVNLARLSKGLCKPFFNTGHSVARVAGHYNEHDAQNFTNIF